MISKIIKENNFEIGFIPTATGKNKVWKGRKFNVFLFYPWIKWFMHSLRHNPWSSKNLINNH